MYTLSIHSILYKYIYIHTHIWILYLYTVYFLTVLLLLLWVACLEGCPRSSSMRGLGPWIRIPLWSWDCWDWPFRITAGLGENRALGARTCGPYLAPALTLTHRRTEHSPAQLRFTVMCHIYPVPKTSVSVSVSFYFCNPSVSLLVSWGCHNKWPQT